MEVEIAESGRLACVKNGAMQTGDQVAVSIRPETVRLSTTGQDRGTGANRLSGTVRNVAFLGDACRVDVQVGERLLQVKGAADFAAPDNAEVELVFDANNYAGGAEGRVRPRPLLGIGSREVKPPRGSGRLPSRSASPVRFAPRSDVRVCFEAIEDRDHFLGALAVYKVDGPLPV